MKIILPRRTVSLVSSLQKLGVFMGAMITFNGKIPRLDCSRPAQMEHSCLLMSNLAADERGLIVACPHCKQRNRAPFEKLKEPFRCKKCHHELQLVGEPFEVHNEAGFDAVVTNSALPVLVDFWAPWCGPCKMIAPELVKVASALTGKWLVAKVDIDQLPNIANRFQISSIPTIAVFSRGQEVARQSGAMGAATIQRFMESARV